MVRFVHTADWQLGRRFERIPGDAGAALRLARLQTVERIGELAIARGADAVLVAGDVFDMNTVHEDTIHKTLAVLARYQVPWVLLPGNHDPALAESVWTRIARAGVPHNVHLALSFEPLVIAGGRLAILPAPLARRDESQDLTAAWDTMRTPDGAIRVGLAHGSVTNRLPERSEAKNPIADDRAQRARLEYLALGDWHGQLKIADRTHYSGTPESDRFRDNGSGHVLWVEIDEPEQVPRIEAIAVGSYRWLSLSFTIRAASDLDALLAQLDALPTPHDRVLVQLRLEGSIDLATDNSLRASLAAARHRFHHMDIDDSSLAIQPSTEDLLSLRGIGFANQAIEALLAIQIDSTHPEHSHAARAISMLYSVYVESAAREGTEVHR